MAYDANYWNSGQFQGNIPSEGPQVNESVENNPNYLNESVETDPNYTGRPVNPTENPWQQPQVNDTNWGLMNIIRNFYNRLPSGQDITNAFGNTQGGSILQGYGQHYGNQGQGQGQFDPSMDYIGGETQEIDPNYMNRRSFLNHPGVSDRPGMFGKPRGFGSGQGWFSRIGQGGGGFMGKFGTGEGWLASGAQRRAARRGEQYGADTQNPELPAFLAGNKEDEDKKQGFSFAGMGQGLMDLASQQGDDYEYNLFG